MSEEINREDYIAVLKDLQNHPDAEVAHSKADTFLCHLLRSLGYVDVVEEYEKILKWYS